MGDLRTPPPDACVRGAPVRLTFDGRTIDAFEGETVAAALLAAEERALMRSIKYHRPRGYQCGTGACAGCLVRVDGTPNVRACLTPVRDGMRVRSQNAMPTARRDALAIVDKTFRRDFDHHERFIRPRILTPVYHAIIRRMAGFGKLPDLRPLPPRRPPVSKRMVDVLVVGAGPAGLAAAVAAAEGAASVLLVEESDRPGGSLLFHQGGRARVERLVARLEGAGGKLLARTAAFGVYLTTGVGAHLPPPGLVTLLSPEGIVEVRPRALLVATGYHETPALFPGNDLPGVMGARAALLLLHRHGILAGRRVALASDAPLGLAAADALRAAGATIVGIVGQGDWKGARLVEARGGIQVDAVVLEQDGATQTIACDAVLFAGQEAPRAELLQQAGVPQAPRPETPAVLAPPRATGVEGVFAAGELFGVAKDATALLEEGARAGEAAAAYARGRSP